MSDVATAKEAQALGRDRVRRFAEVAAEKGLPFVLGAATIGGLAAASGGYYPPSWGWASLALLWVVAAAIVLRPGATFGRAEMVLLTASLLFLAWTALSVAWSGTATRTVWEMQHLIVYVAGTAAALLVLRRNSISLFLGGILLGITAACSYGLITRLFPDHFERLDSIGGYRLAAPLGYWNALGIFAALGILLAVGLAARLSTPAFRALAGATVAILAPTFFFTFSRGAWVAVGVGLLAMVAIDRRRLQLATVLLVLCPAAVLTIWLASRSEALTTAGSPLADASREGHRFLLWVLVLGFASALAIFVLASLEKAIHVSRGWRTAYVCVLVCAVSLSIAGAWLQFGSPVHLVRTGWTHMHRQPPASEGDLTNRLFSLSSNGRIDLAEAAIDDFKANPILGSGAGTYQRYWLEHRESGLQVRDAHSLYLETLAELGVMGVALLLVVLAVPLVLVGKARGSPLASASFAAYVAFLVHAGVDWDWEMTAVTLAALWCGTSLIVMARGTGASRVRPNAQRVTALGGVALLALVSLVGLVGNLALSRSSESLEALDYSKAIDQAQRARAWAPWSSEPWRLIGEAQLASGDRTAARDSLSQAIWKEPENWDLWFSLALATSGPDQQEALAEAARLNPRSTEIGQLKKALGPASS